MIVERRLKTRPASVEDRNTVVALTRYERYVHTHLDWQPPEDWLGQQPFSLAEIGRRAVAALACLPDPPDTAWLRVLVVSEKLSLKQAWEALWPPARVELEAMAVPLAAALSMDEWLLPLLESSGFFRTHDVIGLRRNGGGLPHARNVPAPIRPATRDDLEALYALDRLCFDQPWQLSRRTLNLALSKAANASVAEAPGGELAGYQIGTASRGVGHLARLAVRPDWRGTGLGTALVLDALRHFDRVRAGQVTVNTQSNNEASLALYERLGFVRSGDRFPVYQMPLDGRGGERLKSL